MEVRPKLNDYELELIVEALVKAGYRDLNGTDQYEIWFRFEMLKAGEHVKRRLYRKEGVKTCSE